MKVIKGNIWDGFKKINILSSNYYSSYYKVKNINTGNYFGVKEINKQKYKKLYNYDISINKTNIKYLENEIKFENYYYENEEYLYLIMELGICNLKEYLQMRKDLLSIEEIKDILFQLNKYLQENKYLKLSHILLCSNNINSLEIKILNYSKILNKKKKSFEVNNLQKLIYYILFKKYPNDILIKVKNENLNNLINGIKSFSWEDYFNHPFFFEEKKKLNNNFNYFCDKHSIIFNSYCDNCKQNICYKCLNEHYSHNIILFEYINFNEDEINKIKTSINQFEVYINKFKNYYEKKKYNSIYENNIINNYKTNYIKQLNDLGELISIQNLINIFNLPEIISIYDVKKDKSFKILNCYEESKKERHYLSGINNEKEIRENCLLYLNDNKINFCFQYNVEKEGKYFIKIFLKQSLTNLNYMFYGCSSLTSLNLSNFNTNNVKDMRWMFSHCSSLTSLNLSKFITNNVDNMSGMFSFCSSITSLNLSNFITNNVINMSGMFRNCSS